MIEDFKWTRNKSNSISIMEEEVEVMEEYKYLNVTWITDWTGDTTLMLFIRGNNADLRTLMQHFATNSKGPIFYKSVVESAISPAVIFWGNSIRT